MRIVPEGDDESKRKNILFASRDPGSGNALLPVLKELVRDTGIQLTAITDGRAQELIQKNFQTQDITPKVAVLGADKVFKTPDVILMDLSSGEIGLDTYVAATFPEIPKILVEDYYTTARKFLLELRKRNLPLPEKICVMDKGAKDIIVKEFPDLETRIEITGQPAFDRFVKEDTEKIAHEVKKKLGLQPTDKLVSFMSTMDEPEKITRMAEALKNIGGDFYFAFRRHPRDNVSYETYKQILTNAGIRVVDTEEFDTNDIGAASDVVLTTWSTEGLHGIYRRKPTVHIVDRNFKIPKGLDLPLVPVKLGASVGLDRMNQLTEILPQLLDSKSVLNSSLKKNMEKEYPADGKNARRVANIVRQFIK